MDTMNWAHLLAGIYMFIYAMSVLEESLKFIAGRRFKKFLQKHTENKLKAIFGGTVVTAVLQSSSVVMLIILSFVGAGILSMRNALAITLGANLGTTIGNWMLVLVGFTTDISMIAYPLLALALAVRLLAPRHDTVYHFTGLLAGLGMLFVGLDWMKSSVSTIATTIDISRYASLSPYIFIPIGMVLTAAIQSSSAVMAIVLTALYHDIIPFPSAAAIVLGSETGTTLKILLGSLGGSGDKKRVALGNFLFNLMLSILCGIFLLQVTGLIQQFVGVDRPLIGLVTFQTGINIIFIVILYPFLGFFATWLDSLFKGSDDGRLAIYLQKALPQFHDEAVEAARKEAGRLLLLTIKYNKAVLGLSAKRPEHPGHISKALPESQFTDRQYISLKKLHGEILDYLLSLDKKDMSAEEIEWIGKLAGMARNIIHAAKTIKDIGHNMREMEMSANDSLHEVFVQIQQAETVFYDGLEKLIIDGSSYNGNSVDKMLKANEENYGKFQDHVMALLKNEQISEIDISTLTNVFREIHSSHKTLLNVFRDQFETDAGHAAK